jgi:hypothetical protein
LALSKRVQRVSRSTAERRRELAERSEAALDAAAETAAPKAGIWSIYKTAFWRRRLTARDGWRADAVVERAAEGGGEPVARHRRRLLSDGGHEASARQLFGAIDEYDEEEGDDEDAPVDEPGA